jgi:hypothetical protein
MEVLRKGVKEEHHDEKSKASSAHPRTPATGTTRQTSAARGLFVFGAIHRPFKADFHCVTNSGKHEFLQPNRFQVAINLADHPDSAAGLTSGKRIQSFGGKVSPWLRRFCETSGQDSACVVFISENGGASLPLARSHEGAA